MISDIPPPETIILKSRDTKIKKYYKDTDSTRKMRYELALYNDLRQSTKFSLRNLNRKIINFNRNTSTNSHRKIFQVQLKKLISEIRMFTEYLMTPSA